MAEVSGESESLTNHTDDENKSVKSTAASHGVQNGHIPAMEAGNGPHNNPSVINSLLASFELTYPECHSPVYSADNIRCLLMEQQLIVTLIFIVHHTELGRLDDMSEDEEASDFHHDDNDVDYEDELEDIPFPGLTLQRNPSPDLPETVTVLDTEDGGKVYLVGTAHFSHSSQEDVAKTIRETLPDVVLVELCSSRVNILQLDEATLLEEAKNINFDKIRAAIKQSGMVQGIMHLLLLSMSAHLTKQLGMAPGGEFRRAFQEAQLIQGCRVHLGDRPIQITLRRALGSLSLWQKLRLTWYMITSKEPISAEEVERCKQRDLLEEMLREMTGEFPALSHVFVTERDMFLANSLRIAARPLANPDHTDADPSFTPSVVVGVVGIGHIPGIIENWNKINDMKELMTLPPSSALSGVVRWTTRAAVVGLLSWAGYKLFRITSDVIVFTYHNVPLQLTLK